MAATICLATVDDMRAITSQTLDDMRRLPFLYIATADPEAMRVWGIATGGQGEIESSVRETERLYPGALVAAHYSGETATRGELLYNGAELAADFLPRPE